MNQKLISYILFISIISSSKSFNFEDYNYNDFLINPYRVLGIPPWSSMKIIKGKYRELIKKYHPDQTKGKTRQQFELIQTAYEKIKVERQNYKDENGEEKEINFKFIIHKTFREILIVAIIFNVIYYISYWTYSIQKMLIKPLICIVFSCCIINNFFTHYFNDDGSEYYTAFLIGISLFILVKLFSYFSGKKKQE